MAYAVSQQSFLSAEFCFSRLNLKPYLKSKECPNINFVFLYSDSALTVTTKSCISVNNNRYALRCQIYY